MERIDVMSILKEFKITEEYSYCQVGIKGVIEIMYHTPMGEGDAHYCDVKFESGTVDRLFNPDNVTFMNQEQFDKYIGK